MGKELSICKVQNKLYKDEVMWSADPYCVVQDSYTELQTGTVVSGSVLLQSREVTATSTDPREVFKPASLDTDSTGAATARA